MKHPELFLEFAGLDPSAHGRVRVAAEPVRAFAERWGWLGVGELVPTRRRGAQPLVWGDPLSTWANEIRAMRVAVDLLEAVRNNRRAVLRGWIDRAGGDVSFAREFDGGSFGPLPWAIRILAHEPLAQATRTLETAGRAVAQHVINQRIAPHTGGRLVLDVQAGTHALHLVPRNLLGALWLQAAQASVGERSWRSCAYCSGWMMISADTKRSDAEFCSGRCRVAAHRRRVEARDRRAQGESWRSLAERFGVTVSIVKRWVEGPEKTARQKRSV